MPDYSDRIRSPYRVPVILSDNGKTATAALGTCDQHPAYDADYCPACGTSRTIGGTK